MAMDHLMRRGTAAHLLDGFIDLSESRRTHRMAARDQATVAADRHPSADARRAAVQQGGFVTGCTQAKRRLGEHFFRCDGIVYLQQFKILRTEAGTFIDPCENRWCGVHRRQATALGGLCR